MKFHFKSVQPIPAIDNSEWSNWSWQLRKSLKTKDDFEKYFELSGEEALGFELGKSVFQIQTTPYYAKLASDEPVGGPLRTILMPHSSEAGAQSQAFVDPLGERKNSPVNRIIHRYPDRVLFLVTDMCSVYCRYCTRKHFTGTEQFFVSESEYQNALEYIRRVKGIREVILSGGDPLTLSDARLARIFEDLRKIDHIEIIRVGSRMPVVCPMRMTDDLSYLFKQHKPIYLMTHFNHPKEVTLEASQALEVMADRGTPIMNQLVLLNGVNNDARIVQALSRRLLYLRAKPYYMFQCDPSEGTDHLRTSIDESLEIQKELWGNLSGLALPNLSLDIPNGGGKTSLVPNFETHRDQYGRTYRGWDGVTCEYLNPVGHKKRAPLDANDYSREWNELKNAKTALATQTLETQIL